MNTQLSPTECIEEMLSRLVNSWMFRNPGEEAVSLEEAVAKFRNLPVGALYQLVQTNIYPYLLQTPVAPVFAQVSPLYSLNYKETLRGASFVAWLCVLAILVPY